MAKHMYLERTYICSGCGSIFTVHKIRESMGDWTTIYCIYCSNETVRIAHNGQFNNKPIISMNHLGD